MQFLLSLIGEEPSFDEVTPEQMQADMDRMNEFNLELEQAGAWFLGGGLQERSNARTVRFGEGGPVVTDGPFAETKEQLAGFWIIDCGSLEEALEWTKKVPIEEGVVEVRPFAHELEGKPSEGPSISAEELLEGVKGDAPASS